MSQMGFSQARTGRRGSSNRGSGGVQNFGFTEGKQHRLMIPTRLDDDGNPQVVLFGETVHQLARKGLINLPRKDGKKYSTFTFRCSHPYSQQNHDDAVAIAEKEEICPLCDLEKWQNRRRLDIMDDEYGFEEFKKLPKKEKKSFFENNPLDVEKSYYTKTIGDEEVTLQNREMYMLVIEFEVEEKIKKIELKSGSTKEVPEYVPVKKDGKVQYKPVLYKVSSKKLDAFKTAVDNATQNGILSYDNLHPIIENEGTDFEEEVNTTWVDFQLNFPDKGGDRMSSARDVTISATPDDKSIVVENEEVIEEIQSKMDKIYEEAYKSFKRVFKNLQLYDRQDVIDMFSEDLRNEFNQLEEEYHNEKDDEFNQKVFDTVLGNNEDNESEETEGTSDEEEKEKKPKKKSTKKTTKKKSSTGKKKTTKATKSKSKAKKEKEEQDDDDDVDLDDDIDFDEDDLFDS